MLGEDLDAGSEQTLEPLADSCDLGSLGPLRFAAAGPASGTWLRQALLPLRWKLWLGPRYYQFFTRTSPRFHQPGRTVLNHYPLPRRTPVPTTPHIEQHFTGSGGRGRRRYPAFRGAP